VSAHRQDNVAKLPTVRGESGRTSLLIAIFDRELAGEIERACREHELDVVARAENAAEAVHKATRLRPDVNLIDDVLPGGAVAATWEIRARLPQTKIVLIGGATSDEDLLAALRSGADGFLLKDMNLERLPLALLDVRKGNAALPRTLTARLLTNIRDSGPSWRAVSNDGVRGRLTAREWEVVELLARELTTYEIAERLVLTPSAIRCHISSAVRKLGATSRRDAVRLLRDEVA
jgi:DNA-binding NarL/FixJ family response regulator